MKKRISNSKLKLIWFIIVSSIVTLLLHYFGIIGDFIFYLLVAIIIFCIVMLNKLKRTYFDNEYIHFETEKVKFENINSIKSFGINEFVFWIFYSKDKKYYVLMKNPSILEIIKVLTNRKTNFVLTEFVDFLRTKSKVDKKEIGKLLE
jgi:c-di-AMP phosphodiesterase-like protein